MSAAMMASAAFDFEGATVRVVMRGGEPWFVAADVARVLDIGRTEDAVRRLDDEERGADSVRTPGGEQKATIINESGLYNLILTSRKAAAKRFKRWVTGEVLPAIRKTGGYNTRPDPMATLNDPTALRSLLLHYAERTLALEPKASAYDRIADADGSVCVTDAAKTLQVRPKDLFGFLRREGWIYSRPGTPDIARQEKINQNLLVHKTRSILRTDGTETVATQVRVTPKGIARLAILIPANR